MRVTHIDEKETQRQEIIFNSVFSHGAIFRKTRAVNSRVEAEKNALFVHSNSLLA
jgi:hypothetical protein